MQSWVIRHRVHILALGVIAGVASPRILASVPTGLASEIQAIASPWLFLLLVIIWVFTRWPACFVGMLFLSGFVLGQWRTA